MPKWWGHLKTITAHKARVMKYCFRVGLYRQGLLHDLSKYGPTEFLVGAKYFQGDHSPNEAERAATGISSAWPGAIPRHGSTIRAATSTIWSTGLTMRPSWATAWAAWRCR